MITLSMIVKNEEQYLEDCLKSAKDVVDEIVVVDTGSADSTIEIAKRYNAKVFNFDWINDFAAARNFALKHSTGDWILYLDADERLTPKSKEEILFLTKDRNLNAYNCRLLNIDEHNNRPSVMTYARLFPNDKNIRFKGAIHEQIESSLLKNKIPVKESGIEIIHVGYNVSNEGLKLKAKRNLEILLKEFEKNKTGYYAYHLGQTYALLEETDGAIGYFKMALNLGPLKKEYQALINRFLAIKNAEASNWTEAYNYISKSIEYDKNQPMNLIAAAKIFLKVGKVSEASQLCYDAYNINKKLKKGEETSSQAILMDEKKLIYHTLNIAITSHDIALFNFFYSKLMELVNKEDLELELINRLLNNYFIDDKFLCLSTNEITLENLDFFINIISNYNDLNIQEEILNRICKKYPKNSSALNKLGLILSHQNKFEEAQEKFKESYISNSKEPSTIFYLISACIQTNKLSEIPALISSAEETFKNQPQIIKKIGLLRQKLGIA